MNRHGGSQKPKLPGNELVGGALSGTSKDLGLARRKVSGRNGRRACLSRTSGPWGADLITANAPLTLPDLIGFAAAPSNVSIAVWDNGGLS